MQVWKRWPFNLTKLWAHTKKHSFSDLFPLSHLYSDKIKCGGFGVVSCLLHPFSLVWPIHSNRLALKGLSANHSNVFYGFLTQSTSTTKNISSSKYVSLFVSILCFTVINHSLCVLSSPVHRLTVMWSRLVPADASWVVCWMTHHTATPWRSPSTATWQQEAPHLCRTLRMAVSFYSSFTW